MDMQETARALFGRKPDPEAPPEPPPETPAELIDQPIDQPLTGPVIPGQESMPAHANKSTSSEFIQNLFNN
jgi:hypothetical protein